ncbi:MAG: 4-hydroxy-3-methylbut-2-enyl diphosphate reductase [Alphaproteobacteria bacterium]|jgi:4-hydroxy-3-methylbut-2-enyl diphosphate reductase|nr:4-hydroxy-3-methylbut-2-enyl diphosphate reductase [Alphaproteobacteria bacterium]MDP6830163.1 4-hydroxy-3-methylbut-2-enyl diphosphate reductase [Alphaproteobacteria bacterium]MDP6875184.1 4-hydroxy-3-methylbut-2-enyl diphosphate reductase [Alphaproteobacteria bacterium]
MSKQAMTILLAAPRGFCAGVDRAIQIVELALQRYGKPVYVRHEIVHNRYVVEGLEQRGAVFVDELDQVPDGGMVIFSAHGVAKSVPEEARKRGLSFLDATCPLVTKVHREAENHHAKGRHVIMLGHAGHPEAVGTMGQLPPGEITLLQSAEEAAAFTPPNDAPIAYITQTTLSVDDTASAVEVLSSRFPDLAGPRKGDICYATTNRQAAVKAIAGRCDGLFVIGAPNSSNSKRLVEVADGAGCGYSRLIQRAGDIAWEDLAGRNCIGISAGASAPEVLVEEVLDAFRERFTVTIEQIAVANEDMEFKLPVELRAPEKV